LKKFHLTIGGKRYAIEAEREAGTNRLRIIVDGQEHFAEVEEENPSQAAAPSPARSRASVPRPAAAPPRHLAGGGSGTVLSPLPGQVLSITVKEGDTVAVGDKLLVLEAMKMENVISAEVAGTVRSIRVQARDKVETGQVLLEIA